MSISPLQHLGKQLIQYEKAGLAPDLLESLEAIATKTSDLLNEKAGEFMHHLDDTKHSEQHVQAAIDAFPGAISYKSPCGRLPVQSAVTCCPDKALSFVPLLAREGHLRNVGGKGKQGGLFNAIPHKSDADYNRNVVQLISNISKPKDIDGSDSMCLQVLQTLKEMNLLRREDITKYDLLNYSNHPCTKARFDFFARWVPENLKKTDGENGLPLIHSVIKSSAAEKPKERFGLVLKTNMELFPDDFGMLFVKYKGVSACEAAFNRFGSDEAMNIIRTCIPSSKNYPILHDVMKHVPQYIDAFTRYYFDATYLRDAENRSLFLASLASGNMTFMSNASFFSMATDDQVAEKDPVTDLFPFALAASGDTTDLDALYTLVRRAPGLVLGNKNGRSLKRSNRKRKRE